MKIFLYALLLSACKFSFTTASDVQHSLSNPVVRLNLTPKGFAARSAYGGGAGSG